MQYQNTECEPQESVASVEGSGIDEMLREFELQRDHGFKSHVCTLQSH